MNKRWTALGLAMILAFLPVTDVYAALPTIVVDADEQSAIEVKVTTGTQEAAKEKKEDREEVAAEDDDYEEIETEEEEEPVIEWEEIHIASTADLVGFSRSCWLDTWSRNKHVYLDCDLKLTDSEFESIPTFGGYFDGQGHKIEGLYIDDTVSYTGLFCYVQENAVITNLTVEGMVQPAGKQVVVGGIVGDNSGTIQNCKFNGIVNGRDYTGAIAGFNELTGHIADCVSEGSVSGTHFTGGITGENMGNISRCKNLAEVNITNLDKGMSLEDINLEEYASNLFNLDENEKKQDSAETVNSTVDTGGIAGLSIGVIQYCTNQGTIGYDHVGYNVGGIAGRQSGYLYSCENDGLVYGRKDVGGITGQAEPYVIVDFTQDIVYQLSENINKLHDLISQTLRDAGTQSDTVSSRLSVIQSFTDKALGDTSYLTDKTVEWTDGMVASANEAVGRAEYIMDEASKKDGALDQTKNAATNTKSAATELTKVVQDLDIYSYMTADEKQRYDTYKKNLEDATREHGGYVETATKAYSDYYLDKIRSTGTDYTKPAPEINEADMRPVKGGVMQDPWTYDPSITNVNDIVTKYKEIEKWVHHGVDDKPFPATEEGDQKTLDDKLITERNTELSNKAGDIESNSISYADGQYLTKHGSSYSTDIANYVDGMAGIVLAHTGEMSESTKKDATNAVQYAKNAAGNLETAGGEVKNIVSTVAGKSDIKLPQLGSEYRAKANSLVSNLQGMSDNMGYLNSEMSSANDTLLADIEAVNDQFNVIMLLYTDAIDGALDMDYTDSYEDSSHEVAEDCTDATIAECTNTGKVKGDIDVSGITGTMAIEYDFDLESDVTGIKDAKANSTYQTKCVMRRNTNQGDVAAQKSYAGGICGLQEMGTILSCENYGKLSSDSGDYVGGIAGQSLSYIQKSYAKCYLSGGSYVAGITGSGMNLTDCIAMVRVTEADAFSGAIAGEVAEDGKVHNNFFVGSDLAGIDRISYSKKAEPTSYEAVLARADIPDAFRKLTVSFYSEDNIVKKVDCQYGVSIPLSDYPEIPEKEGYYAHWDQVELNNISFDEEVTAEYIRYLTSLAGTQKRNDKQSIFLVDGKFKEGDELQTGLYSTDGIHVKNILEYWKLSIPEDGAASHQFRYLQADDQKEPVIIYVKNGDKWEKQESGTMGNYQLFTADGTAVEVAIASADVNYTEYICIAAAAVVILLLLVILIRRNRRKTKKKQQNNLEEVEIE
ncbi:MAG: hypothetical protein Q4G60_03805 [bacterium]|nr:hypothetical protein [bacterium]